jgi:transposase InsO family protein
MSTVRRECLDFLIPLGEKHLRRILKEWVTHYNTGRPHLSLGPGIPHPREALAVGPTTARHHLPRGYRIALRPILSGLHHEYRLERIAA